MYVALVWLTYFSLIINLHVTRDGGGAGIEKFTNNKDSSFYIFIKPDSKSQIHIRYMF